VAGEWTLQVHELDFELGFGCIVTGLAASDLLNPVIVSQLRELWRDRGLIVFRGGQDDPDFQVDLSRCFGELQIHAVAEMLHPERTELFVAKGGGGALFRVNGVELSGYIPWHSDQVFAAQTNHGGILRVAHRPAVGGNTGFIDQIAAYDALPEELQSRIDGLDVVYRMQAGTTPNFKFLPREHIELVRPNPFQDGINKRIESGEYPPVVHPLVFTQPETGRKVLNLSPMFADRILGLEDRASEELLRRLAYHITEERRCYDHSWQPGDMVLWDNWRMIHCARGIPDGLYREVHRTSIAGDYALGRVLAA
jgi:taurine dioxygenase